ncbi:hypothetical protein [Nitrosomonas marina]|uniref:Uncharacterized protein n=1 Tax=Nitrosomonas marina TaxID=917 RepID=A0A1H8FXX7_9PROT|nr:hypothetical protein [Nitrosomonas marina]SEN35938.1 hypothetical protein SAMN05216325_11512 [Nitrosomonas marina]
MNNHTNEEVEIVPNYEKIPGTRESYRKIADDFEYSSTALAALGDLMIKAENERLSEHTLEGIGYLLLIVSDSLLDKCLSSLDMAAEAKKLGQENEPTH